MSATITADLGFDADTIDSGLAGRLRDLRVARNLTLDALAQRAGVSRAMVSRVERGESSPTAHLLSRLCNGLGITLATLFADGPTNPLARRAEQATWCDPASGYLRRAVSPPGTGSGVEMAEIEFPPGASVQFDNTTATGADQHVWVLDGVLELVLGGECIRLGPGDCLWMPLDRPLRFHNPAARPVRYVVVVGRR